MYTGIGEARLFAYKVIPHKPESPISVKVRAGGRGRNSFVEIWKEHNELKKESDRLQFEKNRLDELMTLFNEHKSSISKKRPAPVDDDDVILVDVVKKGMDANVDLPHMRSQCGVHPWKGHSEALQKHCDKCFCYVCDKPASECKTWSVHCKADEKVKLWADIRREVKNVNTPPAKRFKATLLDED